MTVVRFYYILNYKKERNKQVKLQRKKYVTHIIAKLSSYFFPIFAKNKSWNFPFMAPWGQSNQKEFTDFILLHNADV